MKNLCLYKRTISSGLNIPNCTFLTSLKGALESAVYAIVYNRRKTITRDFLFAKTVWRTTAVDSTEKSARYLYFLQYPGFTDIGARDWRHIHNFLSHLYVFLFEKEENLSLSIINTDLNYKVLKIIKNIKCLFYLFEKTPNAIPFKIHLKSIHNLLSDFIGVYLYRWMHTEQFRKLNSSCYWISVFFFKKIWYEIISELYLSD